MCIIVVKPSGTDLPSKETLRTCFINNPDGAGFMVSDGGNVWISKGFMRFKHLWQEVRKIKKEDIAVIHFRISTSGGRSKGLCHPFPVSSDEGALMDTFHICDVAVAHNGIIPITVNPGHNDTQDFIIRFLAPLGDQLKNSAVLNLLAYSILGSKLAILWGDGTIKLVGSGWITDNGIQYSNSGYIATIHSHHEPCTASSAVYSHYVQDTISDEKCPKCGRKLWQWGDDYYCSYCGYIDEGDLLLH